ncbi:NDMA-dependent alcohol dehydrogenase [Rhodococcus sp. 1168]|uniref:NDMA-dependent alcohol dehydrogenase n=1 Tax=Rhodococcus sp. 1168 TaxID=2018041 RepID=UPI000A0D895B|nr:NDMA-dependent alcohol dehydrogenase [Rhodococcus sp. 1168]ORI25490.1 alcohol dehydrogenase [Rhodococcus sp. 1168]
MKTKAAVLWGVDQKWEIEEVELGDPIAGEVQVELTASGLCHSDEHVRTGDTPVSSFPYIGGHEGAGIVTKVGKGVTSLQEGDHVVLGFVPACGRCPACVTGHSSVCDMAADLLTGHSIADGSYRHHVRGKGAVPMCLLGTFSPYVTVHEASAIKVDNWIPLDKAALVGCGVTTGWGSSVYAADVKVGETVVIVGAGGIGVNAIQGAKSAGAKRVIAIDPVPFKRDQAKIFGATHTFASLEEATEPIREMTWGRMADKAVISVGRLSGNIVGETLDVLGKNSTAVLTSVGSSPDRDVTFNMNDMTVSQKRLQGALFGSANTREDIPKILRLYNDGEYLLDEMITKRYRLEDINEAYQDMYDGKNIRGLIEYSDADR